MDGHSAGGSRGRSGDDPDRDRVVALVSGVEKSRFAGAGVVFLLRNPALTGRGWSVRTVRPALGVSPGFQREAARTLVPKAPRISSASPLAFSFINRELWSPGTHRSSRPVGVKSLQPK